MSIIVAQAVDPNAGLSERADFFAMVTGALDTAKRKFYLLDCHQGRYDTTEQPHVVTEQYRKWARPSGAEFYRVGIETIFYQTDLFRHLYNDGIVPLHKIDRRSGTGSASVSKMMRILGLAGRYQRGDIIHPGLLKDGLWLPDYGSCPWLEGFEAELLSLSWLDGKEQHAHDDRADAWAMCVDMLSAFLVSAYDAAPVYSTWRFV